MPKEMRLKLPGHFHSALEIRVPLKGLAIYSAVLGLVEFYHIHFEMIVPALNAPLLLIKHMRDLGLPSASLLLPPNTSANISQLKSIQQFDV